MKTKQEYEEAFSKERLKEYQNIDKFEATLGFSIGRSFLEEAARVLACPVKANPPCWQHGRVIYAAARFYLSKYPGQRHFWVDVGTAKGFSALMMAWALDHSEQIGAVNSIDVIDPNARVERNSIADLDDVELRTVAELVAPFARSSSVLLQFIGGGSGSWLASLPKQQRIGFAFIDGKHTRKNVLHDALEIDKRQDKGDMILFDDVQLDQVHDGVRDFLDKSKRTTQWISAFTDRKYVVTVKR